MLLTTSKARNFPTMSTSLIKQILLKLVHGIAYVVAFPIVSTVLSLEMAVEFAEKMN